MPDLGQSFSPANQGQSTDPNLRRRKTPVQQALQTLNLQLPANTGGNAVSNDLLSGRSQGAVRQAPGVPHTAALVSALMGGAGTGDSPGGAGQGRAVRYGGGFRGGGFGDAGGGQTVSAGPGKMPSMPSGGGGLPKPGGGGFQGLLPGGKPPKVQGKPPGVPKVPPSLVSKVPPINPSLVGGGLVDHAVSPPVNFGRGSNDVRFNTPIAQIPQAPQAPPPQIVQPAPPPVQQWGPVPSFALPGGGVDRQAETNYWNARNAGQQAPVASNTTPYGPPTRSGPSY